MPKDVHVLIHGQICTMSEDELMHWKYIKREKQPDGSYKYYYDQSELDAAGKAAKAAETESVKANVVSGNARFEANELREKANNTRHRLTVENKNGKIVRTDHKEEAEKAAKKAEVNAYIAKEAASTAASKAKKAAEKYNKMKMTTFVERTISKGVVAVANLLSGLFKRRR